MNLLLSQPTARNRLIIGGLVALLVLLVLTPLYAVSALQRLQLSMSNPYFATHPTSEQIVIIGLDDASRQAFGRAPTDWSRTVYADLLTELATARARVVAFDLLFSESAVGDAAFRQALLAARASDARTRFVFAAAGVDTPTPQAAEAGGPAIAYRDALLPIFVEEGVVSETGAYLGFTNAFTDVDGTLRRQMSRVVVDGEVHYSFALATFLASLRIPPQAANQVVQITDDTLQVSGRDEAVRIDDNGFWMQNFYGPPSRLDSGTYEVYSLVEVVEGSVPDAEFEDKIVLVGLFDVSGDLDRLAVPSSRFGELMAGVEVQANAVESLLEDRTLRTLERPVEFGLLVALALLSSVVYAFPRWHIRIALMLVALLVGLLVALQLFNLADLLILPLYPLLAISLPAILHSGIEISREIVLRQRADFLLESLETLAEQNLQLERMLRLIEEDLERLLPASAGIIAIREREDDPLRPAHWWNHNEIDDWLPIIYRAEQASETVLMNQTIALPLLWQGVVWGVIVLQHARVRTRLRVLEDLAGRLAPSLTNSLLYREVNEQRAMLGMILGNIPSAVLVTDNQYRIRIFNERAAHLFPAMQLYEETLSSILMHREADTMTIDKLLAALVENVTAHLEIKLGDETYTLDAALIPSLSRWVFVFANISDLIELSELKTRMLRMASHDLKNPLGRVMGYAEMLEMTVELDAKSEKYLHYIQTAAEDMNRLIADLLDLERMRSGRINPEHFSLTQVVQEIIGRHEPDATRKYQSYRPELPDREPLMLNADARQISQVVSNLIGNAIKYTPEGGTIVVRLYRENEQAIFEVEDDGIGISKEDQEQLFTEFYRVKTDQTRTISGTGLGLSLVKSVVETHGGTVGVESQAGQGSRFWVQLPLASNQTLAEE